MRVNQKLSGKLILSLFFLISSQMADQKCGKNYMPCCCNEFFIHNQPVYQYIKGRSKMYLHDSVESLCGRKDPRNLVDYFAREKGYEDGDPVVGIEDENFRDYFSKLIHKYPRFIHNLNFQEADSYTYFVLDIFGGANSYQNTFIEEPSTCQLKAVTIRKVNSTSIYVNLEIIVN